jgi:hypothetical protein
LERRPVRSCGEPSKELASRSQALLLAASEVRSRRRRKTFMVLLKRTLSQNA